MAFINDLELEASCRIAESGGMLAGLGEGYGHVARWLGPLAHMLPPCRDGGARSGKVDRLGRSKQRGRGQGLMDDLVKKVIIPNQIVEYVPCWLKGSKTGYGNRDLTLHWQVPFAMAYDGLPCWGFLLRGNTEELFMRRVNASNVILAQESDALPEGTVKLREDNRRYEKADGTVTVYNYTRLRIEWARVAKHRPDLFLDDDWVPFKPELPVPYYLR